MPASNDDCRFFRCRQMDRVSIHRALPVAADDRFEQTLFLIVNKAAFAGAGHGDCVTGAVLNGSHRENLRKLVEIRVASETKKLVFLKRTGVRA